MASAGGLLVTASALPEVTSAGASGWWVVLLAGDFERGGHFCFTPALAFAPLGAGLALLLAEATGFLLDAAGGIDPKVGSTQVG